MRKAALRIIETEASTSALAGGSLNHALVHIRGAGFGVPEFWGKPSPYTEGTAFLGTPTNHQELLKKRPLSPDVFAIDRPAFHYQMPWGARSSIMNRVTGVTLSVGFTAAAASALMGDLPSLLAALKASPFLLFPAKFAIAYPLTYHYLGGVRHIVWDHHSIGNQADETSLLEKDRVEDQSKKMMLGAVGLSVLLSLL